MVVVVVVVVVVAVVVVVVVAVAVAVAVAVVVVVAAVVVVVVAVVVVVVVVAVVVLRCITLPTSRTRPVFDEGTDFVRQLIAAPHLLAAPQSWTQSANGPRCLVQFVGVAI